MNTPLPKPFTVKIGALTCNVSFSIAPVMITATEPRNIITCHITTKSPMAHYAGDCVKHPQDTDADTLYPFAKVAMKRAVEAMIGGLVIRGDLCPNCLDLKAIYSEFRLAMLKSCACASYPKITKRSMQVFVQYQPDGPMVEIG